MNVYMEEGEEKPVSVGGHDRNGTMNEGFHIAR